MSKTNKSAAIIAKAKGGDVKQDNRGDDAAVFLMIVVFPALLILFWWMAWNA